MSSKIEVQRICEYCSTEFKARTTVTRFCSHKCANTAHKQKARANKVEKSNKQTLELKSKPIEELKAKEFLTVREVARLLNCSIRSAYYYIESGTIKAVNLGQRTTRVKRSEIDRLFEQPQIVTTQSEKETQPIQFETSEYYNLTEVQTKFGISERGLHDLLKRNRVPKIKKGRFAYVPKLVVDKILS